MWARGSVLGGESETGGLWSDTGARVLSRALEGTVMKFNPFS